MSSKNYVDKNGLTYFWGKIKSYVSSMITQSDWNQTTDSASDYVKNKPIYLENFRNSTVCENKSFSTDLDELSGKYYCILSNNGGYADTIYIGGTANLVLNGVSYSGSVQSDDEYGNYYVSFGSGSGYSVDVSSSGVVFYSLFSSESGSISLTLPEADLHVDPNYQKLFDDSIGNIPVSIDWENLDEGQVLGIDWNVGWTNMDIPSNDSAFIITCSFDGSNNHVVDKTWTEITTAINAGKDVYIKCFDYYLYPLTGFEASGSTQGYASFYAPLTWGDGTLENYTVTVWDTTFSGNAHSPWEDNTGTNPVLYFDVSYRNDTYYIGSGTTATDLYNFINNGAIVVLKYDGLYYHLSQYYDMDEIALYFICDNDYAFAEFIVTDRLGTTTITYTYESKPYIKAGTGENAVIINDYYAVPACVASGNGALSEGGATEASGTLSHAEGRMTIAKGNYSHAENQHTYSYGVGSHAEGGTLSGNITISGAANATTYTITGSPIIYGTAAEMALYVMIMYGSDYYRPVSVTVADNVITSFTLESTLDDTNALTNESGKLYFNTVAKGKGSHAEGGATYTHADYSHAEGKQTHAAGANSHAEGLVTTAASANQHVQGKYNIVDSAGTYAHIVGNGTSSSAPSNAHTLDWNGNGWYAGKLTVGTAPTNNMDVATKQYVDTAVNGVTDTNTTYTISISGNVITLTPSTGTAQTITLPVYNGGVT